MENNELYIKQLKEKNHLLETYIKMISNRDLVINQLKEKNAQLLGVCTTLEKINKEQNNILPVMKEIKDILDSRLKFNDH